MIAKPFPKLEAPAKGFSAAYAKLFSKEHPGPGIHDATIYKSNVIESEDGRALLLKWVNPYGPVDGATWGVPQLIPLGKAGTPEREAAIETVRQILWASGHGNGDPLVLSDRNLLGLRAGILVAIAEHWEKPDCLVPHIEGYRVRL